MAEVTAFNAARSKAIEDRAIVGGAVDLSHHLILTRNNGETIDAGNVRGPEGPPGPPGSLMGFRTGMLAIWAGGAPPDSTWLICNGSSYLRSAYAGLFEVIGTTYGIDGEDRFRVPDLRSRIPIGMDSRDTTYNAPGKTFGTKTVTLTTAQLPSHNHPASKDSFVVSDRGTFAKRSGNAYTAGMAYVPALDSANTIETVESTGNRGSGESHNNMPPVMALNYLIKT